MNILRQNLTEEQKKNLWEGEGYRKGRTEGYSEGRTEEREELTQKYAVSMKSLGVSWDIIENVTGLSQATIEAL